MNLRKKLCIYTFLESRTVYFTYPALLMTFFTVTYYLWFRDLLRRLVLLEKFYSNKVRFKPSITRITQYPAI